MAFTPYYDGSRVIPQGVWERAALLFRLQAGTFDDVEAFAELFGPTLAFGPFNGAPRWQPKYMMVQCDGRYEVVIQGTQTVTHAIVHEQGVQAPLSKGNGIVHGLWDKVASDMAANIFAVIDNLGPEGAQVSFVGHSYGGAVAGLVALRATAQRPQWDVSACTFGSPRARGGDTGDTAPPKWVRVVNQDDLIPCLPGPGLVIRPAALLDGVLNRTSRKVTWHHDGVRYGLGNDGGAVQGTNGQEEDQSAWLRDKATWEDRHPIVSYVERSRALQGVIDPTESGPITPAQLRAILGQPPANDTPDTSEPGFFSRLNQLYYGQPDGPITPANVAQFEAVQSFAGGANPLQPTNIAERPLLMATFSNFTKVTLCINNGRTGRLESHVINIGMGDMDNLRQRVEALMTARAALLGNATAAAQPTAKSPGSPQIEFVKLQDAVNPKLGTVLDYSRSRFFGPANSAAYPADFSSVALSTRLTGTEFVDPNTGATPSKISTRYSNLLLGYCPDDAVQSGVFNRDFTRNTVLFEFLKNASNYLKVLIFGTPAWGFMGLNDNEPRVPLTAWSLTADKSTWQFTAAGATWGVGDRIRVTKANAVFNGTYVVSSVAGAVYTVSRAPVTGHTAPTSGFGQRVKRVDGTGTLAFYDYTGGKTDITGQTFEFRASKKNPGREFENVSFFRRKRRER